MQKAFDPITNTARDLKIDDSHIPVAENFYDFCAHHAGKNVKMPFARQLWIAMYLFGEVCNKCTHPKAQDMWNVPVDLDPHTLNRKMTFLKFGRCPKCASTKYELIQAGLLNDYTELVLVGGQRMGKCVRGDTMVQTSKGMLTFNDLDALHADTSGTYGFVPYNGPDLVNEAGKRVKPSHFYREKPMPLIEVTMSNGLKVCGTPNHPIWTRDGWTKLKDIVKGQEVPVKTGQDLWAKSHVRLDTLHSDAEAKYLASVKQTKAVHDLPYPKGVLTELTAKLLGYWVAEGSTENPRHFSVSNHDHDILATCRLAVQTLFPDLKVHSNFRYNRFGLSNARVASFMDELLGGALSAGVKSADKCIPPVILQSPKTIVTSFMSALYEGDGGVDGQRIDYTTISKTLGHQVQVVLSNLGIMSRLSVGKSWATNGSESQVSKPVYTVVIEGEANLRKFRDLIGFQGDRKVKALGTLLDAFETKWKNMPSKYDKLPSHVRSAWTKVVQSVKAELNQKSFLDSWGRTHPAGLPSLFGKNKTGLSRSTVCVTRNRIRSCYEAAVASPFYKWVSPANKKELNRLYKIACDETRGWVSVVSVKAIKAAPTYDVCVPNGHRFMANGLLNHNSTITASMVSYALHRMLTAPKMSSIARGIQDFTPLVGSFVALTVTKATGLLWKPIREMIAASAWFDEYFDMLTQAGKQYGREFFQFTPTGTYLRFFHKNIDLYPEGPSKRTLRGSTRWLAATDELGHFPFDAKADQEDYEDERERANADEVHTVLNTSLSTVQTEVMSFYKKGIFTVPQALNISISSPASWKDKICRLYKENENSKVVLAVKAATWEISPIFSRDHPIIVKAFNANSRRADRDYGANPPSLSSTVFNKEQIKDLFCLDPLYAILQEVATEKTRGRAVELMKPAIFYPSVLGLDAGLTNNAFALTMSYQTPDGLVKAPVALEVVAQPGKKIDFVYLYEFVIKPIITHCNVKWVVADRWNSIHILQSVETDFKGVVKTSQHSLRGKDFLAFQEVVSSARLLLPKLELEPDRIEVVTDYKRDLLKYPASHLYLQFLTVQEIAGILEKGSGYTDDIFRSLVISTLQHFNPKIYDYLQQFKPIERESQDVRSMVIVAGRSGPFYR